MLGRSAQRARLAGLQFVTQGREFENATFLFEQLLLVADLFARALALLFELLARPGLVELRLFALRECRPRFVTLTDSLVASLHDL
ncbi:MAG: hypothetical protein WDN30_13150 [Pararobbsia sp.]